MHRLSIAAVVLALAASPRIAAANSCPILSPFADNAQVPLGCPIVMRAYSAISYTPRVIAVRMVGGTPTEVDVTGTVQATTELMPITYLEYDEDCTESQVPRDTEFATYRITLSGAQVGDVLPYGVVVEPALCPVDPDPGTRNLSCSLTGVCSPPGGYDYGDDNDSAVGVGCSAAGSSSSLGLGLVLLALRRRRRR